jgi:hypothetical protein
MSQDNVEIVAPAMEAFFSHKPEQARASSMAASYVPPCQRLRPIRSDRDREEPHDG